MRRIRLLATLFVLVGLLGACAGRPGSDPAPVKSDGPPLWGTVTGVLRDARGQPVPGALVVPTALDPPALPVPEIAVRTDERGQYRWQLRPGRYELVAHGEGLTSSAVSVSVAAGQSTTADLTMPG